MRCSTIILTASLRAITIPDGTITAHLPLLVVHLKNIFPLSDQQQHSPEATQHHPPIRQFSDHNQTTSHSQHHLIRLLSLPPPPPPINTSPYPRESPHHPKAATAATASLCYTCPSTAATKASCAYCSIPASTSTSGTATAAQPCTSRYTSGKTPSSDCSWNEAP